MFILTILALFNRCPHPQVSNTKCNTNNSIINEECHCKQKCEIEASNDVFGDPCINTYKYVNITYKCVLKKGKVI